MKVLSPYSWLAGSKVDLAISVRPQYGDGLKSGENMSSLIVGRKKNIPFYVKIYSFLLKTTTFSFFPKIYTI